MSAGRFADDVAGAMRGKMRDSGKTAEDLDAARRRNMAYEYLCHLEEARKWLEACLESELPAASVMEEALRNGVILARLAIFFAPDTVKEKHVYDMDEEVFRERGLVFRHTDNVSQWLRAMKKLNFPEIFYPEVTDIYDKKNMPRVIYCVHALSRYLYHLGIAPMIEDLHGIAQFTEEELSSMDKALRESGVQMPTFGKIGGILAKELGDDDAAMHAAILAINQCIEHQSPTAELVPALRHPAAGLDSLRAEHGDQYRATLIARRTDKGDHADIGEDGIVQDVYDINLTKTEIQTAVNDVNLEIASADQARKVDQALGELNEAVDANDASRVLAALHQDVLDVADVSDDQAPRYTSELRATKHVIGAPLTKEHAQAAVTKANLVVEALNKLQKTLGGSSASLTLQVLMDNRELLGLPELNPDYQAEYHAALAKFLSAGGELDVEGIRAAVLRVHAVQAALQNVNHCIDADVPEDTLVALQHPVLELTDVDDAGAFQYQFELLTAKTEKKRDLRHVEIQEQINLANHIAEENARHAAAVFAINECVRAGDAAATFKALQNPYTRVQPIVDTETCQKRYQVKLAEALTAKEVAAGTSAPVKWKRFTTDDGRTYYYNKETKQTQWIPPADMNEPQLTHPEIQEAVDACNADQERADMFKANERHIVRLQALTRGLLVRKEFNERLEYLQGNEAAVVKIQSAFRGNKQRKEYQKRLGFFKDNTKRVVAIQAAWKGHKARQQYKNLTQGTNPPVDTVRKFLHLLDQSDTDFREELALQDSRQKVIAHIKTNKKMEQEVNDMDIKIGLLVKNRMELQHVTDMSRQLKKMIRSRRDGSEGALDLPSVAGGLKSLNKESRERLESFQHLFYLLQTNPNYLARLVFLDQPLERWSPNKTEKFLNTLLQTVYNYASNTREQYLLFNLYRAALRLEVQDRIVELKEFITGHPTVVNLVLNHHRNQHSGTYLKDTLQGLVEELLAQGELDLNTDPVDVYKRWIAEQETQTGAASDLPYDVDRDTALGHEHVRKRIQATVDTLLALAGKFQDTIIKGLPKLPYGLRFICMAARDDLHEKFPERPEDDVIKVLGNILYYRYLNPAIIAPEAYGVLDIAMSASISPVQRRNLGSIAKVLQFAASGQQFAGDQEHMGALNNFLRAAWDKFKTFFLAASQVEPAEEHFNIDEYSDVVMLSKPTIYISPAEIFYTHEMLASNADKIAPEADDPLREVLGDLGDVGDEEETLGGEGTPQRDNSNSEMSLTLTNKFEVPESDDTSLKALFVRTKRMVIELIRCQPGKNLKAILETPASSADEEAYRAFLEHKETKPDQDAAPRKKRDSLSIPSLAQVKAGILENVVELEKHGLCKKENDYQDLLNSVAQDIRNQRIYRRQRKQELTKIDTTLGDLNKKRDYYRSQLTSYDQYVGTCMEQMTTKKQHKGFTSRFKNKHSGSDDKEKQSVGKSYKYTAAKLKEKGVVISIDGVSPAQYRFVSLEMSSKETGVFEIKGSALGVKLEEILVFQDLLQKQYEGVTTTKLFDMCTVNINLLIFLINKKFYGR
eukprot:m.481504 g.481504  ORF g.481504 m.481504 type:complete len:1546 (+) comp22194_c0_seq1:411-5048(+)